jgi:hypothetical protein
MPNSHYSQEDLQYMTDALEFVCVELGISRDQDRERIARKLLALNEKMDFADLCVKFRSELNGDLEIGKNGSRQN